MVTTSWQKYPAEVPNAGQWHPLRIIESFKNPSTELALHIPELCHLLGIAGLINPSSCDTERLVKQQVCSCIIYYPIQKHICRH